MGQLFDSLKGFLREPFKTPLNFYQYVALVGLTIVIVTCWQFVLKEIERGVREV